VKDPKDPDAEPKPQVIEILMRKADWLAQPRGGQRTADGRIVGTSADC
jgi:hypothetical protein